MAERGDSGGGGDLSSSSATASLPADRRRAMTSSKRGHQHHPKFLGNRPPASAVEVITALRSRGTSSCGELPLLLDRLNNNSRNKDQGCLDNDKANDPPNHDQHRISQTDIKSVKVAALGVGVCSSANAQVEQKNVSNLLIESPQPKAATQTTTINAIADESGAGLPRTTKAIRSMDDDGGDSKRSDPVLQQRRKEDECDQDSLLAHCDTEFEQRPPASTTNLVSQDNECDVEDNRQEDSARGEMIDEDEDSLNNNNNSSNSDHLRRRRKSNKTSVLTERNSNKSSSTAGSKRRSAGGSAGVGPAVDVDEDATGVAVEPKRKSPSSSSTSKKEKSGKEKKKSSRSTRTTGNNTKAASDGAMDQSVSTDMTSSQESRSEDTENDPEAAEWAKLRCTSERTEVVAEREYRRQNRRCADYPGLAFGRSIFSSDTMMKFNIIRNELHNIMKTQLKRVRVAGGV